MTCAVCGTPTVDFRPGRRCYGCFLREKDISISGETVAGVTFGRKPQLLTDTAVDQRIEAGEQLGTISKAMQAGGPIVQDRLQRDVDRHTSRAMDAAAADGIKPLYADTPTGFQTVEPCP